MAHVHDEYLDVTEDDVNVQLEMVVSSEDGVQEIEHNSAIHVIDEDCGDSQNDDRAGLKRELRSSEVIIISAHSILILKYFIKFEKRTLSLNF